MKITVNLPDRISHRDTHIASRETDRKALKSRLEKKWRKCLCRYRPLTIPIRCVVSADPGLIQFPPLVVNTWPDGQPMSRSSVHHTV